MIRKLSMFAAFAVLGCTSLNAASDGRIKTLVYAPDKIVQIIGKSGIQSTIEFGPDERIENVAVGDSSKWQITPNHRASMLFVKPLAPRSRTNMTVVTDQRTYMFDLVAGDKWTTPLYALKFSYPNQKPNVPQKGGQAVIAAAASAPAPSISAVERLHFDWKTKGDSKLLPERVFDDGQAVYLSWRSDRPLPAILTVSDDRKEGPVNYRMSGEYIVISPIPQNLLLRYGKKSAQLWPTHPINIAPGLSPNAVAGAIASGAAREAQATSGEATSGGVTSAEGATVQQPAPRLEAPATAGSVKFANMATLYTDKLTDGRQ